MNSVQYYSDSDAVAMDLLLESGFQLTVWDSSNSHHLWRKSIRESISWTLTINKWLKLYYWETPLIRWAAGGFHPTVIYTVNAKMTEDLFKEIRAELDGAEPARPWSSAAINPD
jgi:hypothetical protein